MLHLQAGYDSIFRSGFAAADGAEYPFVLCHGCSPISSGLSKMLPITSTVSLCDKYNPLLSFLLDSVIEDESQFHHTS